MRTALIEAHYLFGYRFGIPLAGDSTGLQWLRLNYIAGACQVRMVIDVVTHAALGP